MSTTQREDVSILIDRVEYRGWTDIEIVRGIDSCSAVSFSAPFDDASRSDRERFRPFSFREVTVLLNDSPLFEGMIVDVTPKLSPNESAVGVSCYSRPAVLQDVTMPASEYPLELNGLNLLQIAQRMGRPFGITARKKGVVSLPSLDRVAIEPDKNVWPFLADLAKQSGVILSDTTLGELLILQSTQPGSPVARLREGAHPVTKVTPTFAPQGYYSEITGLGSARPGRAGSAYTQKNAKLRGVLRPSTFKPEDAEAADVPAAVRARMGRMFGNIVTYQIDVPTWRDPRGSLWSPDTTLTLTAPKTMVYSETEMLVREVTLKRTAGQIEATLAVVLPGAFSGAIPERLPWDD